MMKALLILLLSVIGVETGRPDFSIETRPLRPKWKVVSANLLFSNPPFQSCHASTIVEDNAGGIWIACFGGSGEGRSDVAIFLGKISAEGKATPREAANGVINDTLRYPCWNPVLFKKQDGQLVLFYKVGPNPRQWWGMFKTSDDNGATWSAANRLPNNLLGPIKDKPVQLPDGTLLCPSSIEHPNGRWTIRMEVIDPHLSTGNFIPVDTNSRFDVIQPAILQYPHKRLQILCRSKQGRVIQSWSSDHGKTWSDLTATTLLNPNSGIDAVTLKDGRQLIAYNPDTAGNQWSDGRARLRMAISDDGKHWRDILDLENRTTGEYSYPAVVQTSDGLLHITYTYDRKNIKHVVIRP
ncbi:MAG TPA: sialidase family protein [Puia sp.]|nr:sialidase family protein [Puia sp.]